MALSTATITFDVADQVGVDFDARRTKVWVTTNVPGETVIDVDGGKIRLGSGNVTIAADGTGSATVWVPGAGSNPDSWQTSIHFDYPDRHAPGGRKVRTFGPFTITGSDNLADLVEEQEIPPTYLTQVTGALAGYVTDAETAADAAAASAASAALITGLTGEDEAVAALVADSGSDTAVALSDTIVERLSEDSTVVNAAAVATGFGWLKVSATAPARTADVTTTNASAAVTAVSGTFSSDDVGAPISGTGIPAGATIAAVASGTSATLSAPATASGTVSATIGIIKVNGLAVAWIDQTDQLTPVPVNPPSPTWNNAAGTLTVPSGVVGVDYVWTSGGGGLPGGILTPGATLATSGAYPRNVTITAVPKPGYTTLATYAFTHSFPDPTTITVYTSDAFTGGDAASIYNRATDATLGGTAKTWGGSNDPAWAIESGVLKNGSALYGHARINTEAGADTPTNMRVEFDVIAMSSSGVVMAMALEIGRPNGAGGIILTLGAGRYHLYYTNAAGDSVSLVGAVAAQPLGHYVLELYESTLRVVRPGFAEAFYDVTLMPSAKRGSGVMLTNTDAAGTITLDNLVISKMGA